MKKVVLGDVLRGKSTNVDLIKFIAAILVIISHAFVLSTGNVSGEWLVELTRGQTSMGEFAVGIFFFYSGLLISRSLDKGIPLKKYVQQRIRRIFPPLIFVVVCCTVVIGPFFTTLSHDRYFVNLGTWGYLLNGLCLRVHELPGVFQENIYTATVNGSLWTLRIELFCYVGCFILFCVKWFQKAAACVVAAVLLAVTYILAYGVHAPIVAAILPAWLAAMMFYMGILYWKFKDELKLSIQGFIGMLVLMILLGCLGRYKFGYVLAMPYILSYLGFMKRRVGEWGSILGSWSYGIYLCAFPIQQCVVQLFGGSMNPYANMLVSILLSTVGGQLTFDLIEKKF